MHVAKASNKMPSWTPYPQRQLLSINRFFPLIFGMRF
jgi:hypothetical protein